MIKKIVIVLLVVVAGVLIMTLRQPDTYTVERRGVVKASPDSVFAYINDFHRWDAWSPWAKLDPAITITHSGAPAGPGAIYEWTGNSKVGIGRMEIKQSTAPSDVAIALHFIKPVDSESVLTFQLAPKEGGTEVIWTMRGEATLMSKAMGVFMSMDKMIGPDFERGLSQLKTAAEGK
jgi:hypothetical protein